MRKKTPLPDSPGLEMPETDHPLLTGDLQASNRLSGVFTVFLKNEELYLRVIREAVPATRHFLWIGTSDIKDMYVHGSGKFRGKERMIPFLEILSDLIQRGVSVRMIHAKEPGPAFQADFDRYPVLSGGLEHFCCPRIHFKSIIIDGRLAYSGSANLTGAGLGAKSKDRRNFEAGFFTSDPALTRPIMEQFDQLWMGKFCPSCRRREFCSDYQDLILK